MAEEECQLNLKQALSLCRAVGFRGEKLITAVAVMGAESGRIVEAYNQNDDPWESADRGLFQINDHWHPDLSAVEAFNPFLNAQYAYGMSEGGTRWESWAAYTNGSYLVNVVRTREELDAAKAGEWINSLEDRVTQILRQNIDWNPCK